MEIEKIRQLVAELLGLMDAHQLAELEVEESGSRIRLKKAQAETSPMVEGHAMGPSVQAAPATSSPPAAVSETQSGTVEILSPIVGTFYRSSGPDAEPFVDVGVEVNEETVVCIIEAMKVMNEIKAEVQGRIVAILVENGESVEYGQPLFRVKQE